MSLYERFTGDNGRTTLREALERHASLHSDLEVIDAFIDHSQVLIYSPGDALIREGETDRDILYILVGEVKIEKNGDESKRRGIGNHVGEMALVDTSSVRSATVRAVIETAVLKVSAQTFYEVAAKPGKGFLWRNIAIELGERLRQRLADIKPVRRLVLLVHGIRTRAEWQQMVKDTLEDDATTVVPIKYGRLDLIRFWFPIFTRSGPIRETEVRICRAIYDYPDREVIVIAHSFGTYSLSKILQRNPLIRINRLLLCGGIVSDKFSWGRLPNRPTQILNDCGHKDWCPILAKSFTWGYGATGVFGSGSTEVYDRFFGFGHSGFFRQDFVTTYWKPFVEKGIIEKSSYTPSTISDFRSILASFTGVGPMLLMALIWLIWQVIRYF
jgi:CRP-like cAMP-binding protein